MNILLTCAGRRNYLVDYFREALSLQGGNVYAANSTPDSTALIAANKGFVVPSLYDPDYINTILRLCRQWDIGAIVPLFDLELPILSKARSRFEAAGVQVVVSSPDVIEVCNDKWLTREFLVRHGIETPQIFLDPDSATAAAEANQVTFPLIIKPRYGVGSIGLLEAENEAELRVFYSKCRRVIESSYLATESQRDSESNVIIQEKLRGQEYGLDIINNLECDYMATLAKKKLAMRSGETDMAMTVKYPLLEALGKEIALTLGHVANLDVDLFVNEEGAFVLEMNPRFGGGYPFSHLAGANLPAAIVSWLQGEEADHSYFEIDYQVKGFKGILPMGVAGSLEYLHNDG